MRDHKGTLGHVGARHTETFHSSEGSSISVWLDMGNYDSLVLPNSFCTWPPDAYCAQGTALGIAVGLWGDRPRAPRIPFPCRSQAGCEGPLGAAGHRPSTEQRHFH